MISSQDPLVQKVCDLYEKISKLENLNPSEEVDALFAELMTTIKSPQPIDVTELPDEVKLIRNNLMCLSGEAEFLREKHYALILGSHYRNPLDHLHIYPIHSNYIHLTQVEYDLLIPHCSQPPRHMACVGSGPLPLTSILLALHHLTSTVFHNYDIDSSANAVASKLVASHPDLSKRMEFKTSDVMSISGDALKEYDVVFLASLVGVEREAKMRVIEHLAKYMAPGAILMLRSAHGARAFLYPVVEPSDLKGFEVLSLHHPTDKFINSVIIARKVPEK